MDTPVYLAIPYLSTFLRTGMPEPQRNLLLLSLALVVVISIALRYLQTPLLIWNTTPSLPKGLYRIHAGYDVGDIVAFDIPESILPLVRERGWIPDYDRLLKRVVAVPGYEVCFREQRIFLQGEYVGQRSLVDSKGRAMPQLTGCHTVQPGQVWVMLKDQPLSLDSRYFGAVDTATIYGKAEPVFTY